MNNICVLKFGGAAVSDTAQFAKIADIIVQRSLNARVVVVLSAMANATDQLFSLAKEVHPCPPLRELDMLVSVGERISIALLAMALQRKGKEAVSFTGSQSGIITSSQHSTAQIFDVKPHRILRALDEGRVVIVAGFQGVSSAGEITTLGRGGSDTTAVALGIALGADKVDFYKDVAGIYSEDPKCNQKAFLHETLGFQEALTLIERGAKVLHPRSVKLAEKNALSLHVCCFHDPFLKKTLGTRIGKKGKMANKKVYEIEVDPRNEGIVF